ncbi:MAG: hypothetical protein WEC80_02810, partial [Patescibacteria group bacterium]
MSQEFASDNSGDGLFDRLKFNKHRGFFSLIFVTLSAILLLVTFSAVQQQQTTQSSASGYGNYSSCSEIKPSSFFPENDKKLLCENAPFNCEWKNSKCIDKGSSPSAPSTGSISEGSRCKSDSGATVGTCVSGTVCTALNDGTKAAVCRKTTVSTIAEGSRCKSDSGATVGTCVS